MQFRNEVVMHILYLLNNMSKYFRHMTECRCIAFIISFRSKVLFTQNNTGKISGADPEMRRVMGILNPFYGIFVLSQQRLIETKDGRRSGPPKNTCIRFRIAYISFRYYDIHHIIILFILHIFYI